jgi:hypothetical protein
MKGVSIALGFWEIVTNNLRSNAHKKEYRSTLKVFEFVKTGLCDCTFDRKEEVYTF